MRHRVEEAVDLDVIIERDAGEAPFGELVVGVRQRRQGAGRSMVSNSWRRLTPSRRMTWSLMRSSARGDGRVGLGQREEGLPPQPAEDVGLGEADAGLDLGLVAGLARSRRQDADAVMGGHHPVAAVDLGVVERGLVDAALQIVGHDQARHAAEEAEHADMGADPVRQRLRPGRLGVGEVRGAEHGDEDLRLADFAGVADRRSAIFLPE